FRVLDTLGGGFVTKKQVEVFRVMRFLVQRGIVSFADDIAVQSSNNLYPANLFLEVMENFTSGREIAADAIDRLMRERLEAAGDRAAFRRKNNSFSSDDYRFIKFITRRLIRVEWDGGKRSGQTGTFTFFYPFEVQIVDYETYLGNLSGPASHASYK